MRKLFGTILVLLVAFGVAVTSTAIAADKSKPPNPTVVITKNCPAPKKQKTYRGNIIVIVSGTGCVTVDNGAVAKASGNATVVAHGDSTVVASGAVTLVVYNEDVSCVIKGRDVTVVSAIKDDFGRVHARCLAARPKKK